MSAIGHRRSSPTDMPFVGEVAVNDFYLNPEPEGCAMHDDPECLCDVTFDTPTPVRATPDFLVSVTNAEELIRAGCNLWLQLDVMQAPWRQLPGIVRDFENKPQTELPSTEKLQEWAQMVRQGLKNKDGEKLGINRNTMQVLRALTNCTRNKRRILDADLVAELADSGMSVRQIREWFRMERHQAWSYSAISKAYQRATGRPLRVLTNAELKAEREAREAEAYRLADEEGLTQPQIGERLGVAPGTVAGYFRRRNNARMRAA